MGLREGEQHIALARRDLVRSQPPARQEQLLQTRIAQQRLPHLQQGRVGVGVGVGVG